MYKSTAQQLRNKTVECIERQASSVMIKFTDGTAVEIGHSHPSTIGKLQVYFHRPKQNGDQKVLRQKP